MAFTPVATTDTLETFRTRYNATNITLVDDSSTSVDITLATDSLKLSGGTGIASAISGDVVTFTLSNTGVGAASYGSSTAIPVLAINAQGQITSASTASISTDLTLVDDASTAATISLATDTLKISGGTGTTSAISGDTVTINLDNTAVSAGSFGSSTAIPVLAIDAQGRITGASTASVSTDLTIVDDSSTSATISLGTDTLKFAGGAGVTTSISGDVVTFASSATAAFTDFIYTATSGQTTFSGADDNGNTLAYAAANFDVFLNGVLLDDSDYTATNTTSVVLSSAAAASDILTGKAWNVNNVSSFDLNGTELILDADGDTSITADTDDQIDIRIGGADDFAFKANSFEVQTGSIIDMNGTELVLDADGDTSIHADTDDQIDFKVGGVDVAKIDSNGVEGASLVKLAGETLSADASSIEISASTLTTSYTNYELYANLKPVTDGGIVFLRLRDNTATLLNTVSDYSIKANRGGGTTFDDTTVSALTLISGTGNASGENEFIKYTIGDIRTSDRRCCILYSSTGTTTAGSIHAGYGVFITNVAEDNQGIQLTFSSGDIASGSSYALYGVKG